MAKAAVIAFVVLFVLALARRAPGTIAVLAALGVVSYVGVAFAKRRQELRAAETHGAAMQAAAKRTHEQRRDLLLALDATYDRESVDRAMRGELWVGMPAGLLEVVYGVPADIVESGKVSGVSRSLRFAPINARSFRLVVETRTGAVTSWTDHGRPMPAPFDADAARAPYPWG